MLLKNLFFMASSTLVRLMSGLVSFAVLARIFGPERYGVIMLWLSIATLFSLISNFGFTPYILREISREPSSSQILISEGIVAKLLLAGFIFSCVLIVCLAGKVDEPVLLFSFLVAATADGFAEFFNAACRACGRFDVESRIAIWSSIFHAILIITVAYFSNSLELTALAYALSRVIVCMATLKALGEMVERIKFSSIHDALLRMKTVGAYAADFAFQSLFGQIDNAVLNQYLGAAAIGVYQAGFRVFQAGLLAPQILGSVYLPRLSKLKFGDPSFYKEKKLTLVSFMALGGGGGGAMALFGEQVTLILYGDAYVELAALFPLFGLLYYLRLVASASGIVLTASGFQGFRTWAGVVHWITVAICFLCLAPGLGISRWIYALCAGSLILGILYAWKISDTLIELAKINLVSLVVFGVAIYKVSPWSQM